MYNWYRYALVALVTLLLTIGSVTLIGLIGWNLPSWLSFLIGFGWGTAGVIFANIWAIEGKRK